MHECNGVLVVILVLPGHRLDKVCKLPSEAITATGDVLCTQWCIQRPYGKHGQLNFKRVAVVVVDRIRSAVHELLNGQLTTSYFSRLVPPRRCKYDARAVPLLHKMDKVITPLSPRNPLAQQMVRMQPHSAICK